MGISKRCVSEPRDHHPARGLLDHKVHILVDTNGHGCLAGFGLVTTSSDRSTDTSSLTTGGTIRWMSPELLDPGRFGLTEGHSTKESDCYALGMTIYEVLGGETPFAPPAFFKILNGQCPERPQGKGGALFTDDLWRILGLCWEYQPGERTNAKVVLQCLERTSLLLRPPSDMDRIVETDTDESLDFIVTDSGMFLDFAKCPRLTFNHPCGMSGITTTPSDRLPVPPRRMTVTASSTRIQPQNNPPAKIDPPVKVDPLNPMNSRDGGNIPGPRRGSSRKGWVSGLVRKVRGKFKTGT